MKCNASTEWITLSVAGSFDPEMGRETAYLSCHTGSIILLVWEGCKMDILLEVLSQSYVLPDGGNAVTSTFTSSLVLYFDFKVAHGIAHAIS